jgi:hypothetical protein
MLNRRDAMIRLGKFGLAGLTLPQLLFQQKAAASVQRRHGTADAVIYIFLWGGPPQQDMWDLKPSAPQGIRSLFNPIRSVVPGIHVSDQLPLLAKCVDKTAIIRSFAHGSNLHEPSVYHVMTGQQNPTLVVPRNMRKRADFPNFGSVVSYFQKPNALPASATIPRPLGHDGVIYSGTHAGFLGPRYDPMERTAANLSPEPASHSMALTAGLNESRLQARHGLLRMMETQDHLLQSQRGCKDLDDYRGQAMRMVTSQAARRAFDLESESPKLRDRYGRNEYGESMLLARRLVEAGVKVVSIIWMHMAANGKVYNVWDNHGGTEPLGGITGYAMLKQNYCLPPLDQGYSALLEDLSDRGMLDTTLVVQVGEFGRTPKINTAQGRDHWGMCGGAVLAGGGIKGGQVYGASDKTGAFPTDNPVSPGDLLATIYHSLGLDPEAEIQDREGKPHRLCDGQPVGELFG